MKSMVQGPMGGHVQDDSDESDDGQRTVASAFRNEIKKGIKAGKIAQKNNLRALSAHAQEGIKGQKTVGAAVRRHSNAFKVNKEEEAKDMLKESLQALNRHAKRGASANRKRKTAVAIGGKVHEVGTAVGGAIGAVAHGVGHVAGAVVRKVGSAAEAVGNYLAPAPVPAPRARGRSTSVRAAVPVPTPPVPVAAAVHPAEAAHRAKAQALGIDHSQMVFTNTGEPHKSRKANAAYFASQEQAPAPPPTHMGLRKRNVAK